MIHPAQNEAESNDAEAWLTVTTDQSRIEDARRRARDFERDMFEGIFAHLDQSQFLDSEGRRLLQRRREEVVGRLADILADKSADRRIGAAVLLLKLGDGRGLSVLTHLVTDGNSAQVKRILNALGESPRDYVTEELTPFAKLVVGHAPLTAQMLTRLEDRDSEIAAAAMQACGILELSGAGERITRNLTKLPGKEQDRALYWLSRGQLTAETFELGLAVFQKNKPHDAYWSASFLEAYAAHEDPRLRPRARQELRRILESSPDDGKRGFDGNRLGALEALAKGSGQEDLDELRATIRREKGLYKEAALGALVRLDAPDGKPTMLKLLNDADGRRAAIGVAQKYFAGTADPEVTAALIQIGEKAKERELSQICEALWAVGGPRAKESLVRFCSRLDEAEAEEFQKRLTNLSLDEICARVEAAKLLSPEQLAKARQSLESPKKDDDEEGPPRTPDLTGLLGAAGVMTAFDAETGMFPNRHDELLQDFAETAGSLFQPEAASEEALQTNEEDYDCDYLLRFIANGKLYEGRLRGMGDWYDVERTVAMINRALKDSGKPEQFVGLAAEGQIAVFILADPAILEPLAKELHMPLSHDLNEAMEKGVEFERNVIKSYSDDDEEEDFADDDFEDDDE